MSGGTPNYTYNWNTGATSQDLSGLVAGTYTVTVTDNNSCTASASYTVSQAALINLTSNITNVACNGASTGAIDLTVSGGTPNYTYNWSTGATIQDLTGVAAGTYTVTVTDGNSCTRQQIFSITQPSSLTVGTSSTPASCGVSNGTATAIPSGGVLNYTYLWNTGGTSATINALAPTTYTVTVTDGNSCTRVANVIVSGLNSPVIVLTSQTNVTCNGASTGAINITVIGGTPNYTYLWSNSATTQDLTGVAAGAYTVTVTDASLCTSTASYTVTQPTTLALTSAITNVNCNGATTGAIDLTVSGGTPNYTYNWSTGATSQDISGLIAGTFTVTITDANSCTASASYTVSQATLLQLNISSTQAACGASNGTASVVASGGTLNYSYLWSNGGATSSINSLSPATYTVTVTDGNGCTKSTSTVVVSANSPAISTFSITNVSCNGGNNGAIDITVIGGTNPISYLWSNGQSTQDLISLIAGIYTVTVTDIIGCSTSASYTVSQPALISLSSNITNVNCNGGSTGAIDLTVIGGTPNYSYNWNTGATSQDLSGLSAGIYTVTVTDNNSCTSSASHTVSQPALISLSSSITNVNCNGGSIGAVDLSVSGGTPNYTYNWNTGVTSQDLSGLSAGIYTVTVTDNNSCTSSASYSVSQPALFNLTSNITNVACSGGSTGAIDLSVGGGTPNYTYNWSTGATSQDISGVSAGTYTVTVTDANSCTSSASYTVSQTGQLSATFNSIAPTCINPNGSLTVVPSGGTPSYSYLWNTGAITATITNLISGNYTVTVTDVNSCSRSFNTVLTGAGSPIITTDSLKNVRCNGESNGAIYISVSGGTFPYTYLWNTGATAQDLTGLTNGTYTLTVTDFNLCTVTNSFTITQPAFLSLANFSTTSASCSLSNGSAIVNPVGGIVPYGYLWSNGATTQQISNISAGTYSVTVTDFNGCTRRRNIAVSLSNGPIISLNNQIDVSCNGGSNGALDIGVTSGSLPYTYSWSNGATTQDVTNLLAGNVTIIVTDFVGCSDSANFEILEPLPININSSITPASCGLGTGAITITPNGGTPGYTFLWSNGGVNGTITSLLPGVYTVTVTDNLSCTKVQSFTVNSSAGVTLVIDSVRNTTCPAGADGNIYITPSSGLPSYQYLWSNGSTIQDPLGLTAGTYTVTVTDANTCTATISATVTSPPNFQVSYSTTNSTCNLANGSATANVLGGTSPYTYLWETGSTSNSISNQLGGYYSVTITDLLGCVKIDSVEIVNSGQATIQLVSQFNPLCNSLSTGSLSVNSTGGVPTYTYNWSNGGTTNSINGLSAGTYTVTVTDQSSCTSVASYTITQPDSLKLQLVSQDANCNLSNGVIASNVIGGTLPYNYNWSNGFTSPIISSLAIGIYTLTVTDLNNCQVTTSDTIGIKPPPSLSIASITDVLCNGSTTGAVDLNVIGGAAPFSFLWSNGALTEDLNGVIAGTYSVTATDSAGCSATTSATITEPSPISLQVIVNDAACGNNNGSIVVTPNGGVGGYSFLWSNGGISNSVSNLTAGTYTITVTDINSCSVIQSIIVNNLNAPQVTLLSKKNVSCFGGSDGELNINIVGGIQPYNYLWSNAQTSQNLNGLQAGVYVLTLTDANNCISTFTDSITQPDILSINGNVINESCDANNGVIIIVPSGGTPAYTYLWSTGDLSSTISGLTAGNYTVTVTDSRSCTLAQIFSVINTGVPSIALVNIDSVDCNGGASGAINIDVSNGLAPYTFTWINTTQVTEDVVNLPAGNYSVIATDFAGCTTIQSYSVGQPPAIVINFPLVQNAACGVANGQVAVSVSGGIPGYTLLWSNGSVNDTITNLNAGSYSVTVTDSKGCSNSAIANISNSTGPAILNVDSGNVSCPGLSDGFIDISVGGGTLPYSFSWSNLPDTVASVNNLIGGTYTLTVLDGAGCIAIRTVVISSPNPILVSPVIPQSNPPYNLNCFQSADGKIFLSVNGGTSPYNYVWSNGAITQNISNLNAGNYTVFITDNNGCTFTSSYILTEPPQLVSNAGTDVSLCGTDITNLNANVPSYGIGFWQTSTSVGQVVFSDSTLASTQISNLPAGDNIFIWTVTDGACAASSQVLISVTNAIQAIAGIDRKVCENLANLNATRPQFGYGYWITFSPGVLIEDSSKAFTPVSNLNLGNNFFQWTVVNGSCRDSARINIFLRDSIDCLSNIQLPTAFSPNSDGFNDEFIIKGIADFPNNYFTVYNRWGAVVFEKNNYRNNWKGVDSNGDPLPDGTYFVIFKVESQQKVYKNYLDLRR